jgi:hypothetical protein
MAMIGYHILAAILGYLAGAALCAGPLAALAAVYRWDSRTWEDRVERFRIARGDRLWRDTPDQRALADLATTGIRHTVLDPAGLPPAASVARDPLTQPVLARVDLRKDLPDVANHPIRSTP